MRNVLLSALGVALVSVGIAYFAPLSTGDVPIVHLRDAPEVIVLEPGKLLAQRMHLSVGTYSGVAIFSDIETLDGRTIRVVVRDRQGNIVARGRTVNTSYESSANVMKIEIPVTWFRVSHDDFFVVEIELAHGKKLPLRVMPRETNTPKVHRLSIDNESSNALLAVTFVKRVPASFGLRQGIVIGSAFLLGVAGVASMQNQRKKYWAAIALICVFAPLAVLGYFFSTGDLGIADWDFYFTLHDSYRKAILEHSTFPFWNPYICGGTAGLGDPEFPVFSFTFLLELLFGIPFGVRLAITLSVIVGATGMLTLARSLGRSVEAGLIASLAVAFGTVNLLEITEGHVNVLAAMWIPWIFWSWLQVYRGKRKPIVCAFFLVLTFLAGGIYLLMYTTFAFLVFFIFVPERLRAVAITVQAGAWALGLVSFKLIPVLYWLKQFPDDAYQASAFTLPWIVDILFGRHIHGAYVVADQASGWHEYGAYIGYIVFGLALVGVSYLRKSRMVFALCVSALVALFVSAFGPQLEVVFDPLWFFPRSNISRLILFAVIPISLLASYGADRVASVFRNGSLIRALLVGIIAIDIFSLTYQLSEQAFVLPHVIPVISPAPSPIAYTSNRYDLNGEGSRTTRSYDAYKAGYGIKTYCSVLGPDPGVQMIEEDEYSGFISTNDSRANVSVLDWNYNTVKVHVDTPVTTLLVLNANYVDGWTVQGKKTTIFENRIALEVEKGSHDIIFEYKAPGFLLGLSITIVTILIALLVRTRYY